MPERPTIAELEMALRALGPELEVPPTPSLAPAVASRLLADRAAGGRSAFPRRALWTRRTKLVVAVVATLALLAVAAGARFVIGAAEVRVQPGVSSSGPPLAPPELGDQVALDELSMAVGFAIELPAGRAPDAAYAVDAGTGAALLAWKADDRSPRLPGTPWGLVLMEIAGTEQEILVKTVNAFEDTDEVRLDGAPAYWIHAPHELEVITDSGEERFHIEGNVLIWERGGITYRLETPLDLAATKEIAGSIG
jgi:hypothetical protein